MIVVGKGAAAHGIGDPALAAQMVVNKADVGSSVGVVDGGQLAGGRIISICSHQGLAAGLARPGAGAEFVAGSIGIVDAAAVGILLGLEQAALRLIMPGGGVAGGVAGEAFGGKTGFGAVGGHGGHAAVGIIAVGHGVRPIAPGVGHLALIVVSKTGDFGPRGQKYCSTSWQIQTANGFHRAMGIARLSTIYVYKLAGFYFLRKRRTR